MTARTVHHASTVHDTVDRRGGSTLVPARSEQSAGTEPGMRPDANICARVHLWRTNAGCCQPGPNSLHQMLGPGHVAPARCDAATRVLDQAARNQVCPLPRPRER